MNPAQDYQTFEFNAVVLLAVAACVLVIGLIGASRRPEGYTAADRGVPPLFSGMATSSAFLSAAPFLGLAGLLFALGSDGLAWLVGIGAGFVLMGVLIAPAFRASGALSVPEFLGKRFGGRLVPLLATLIVLGCSSLLLVAQFAAIGTIADRALNVPGHLAIAGAAFLVAVTLGAGGMRSAIWLGAVLIVAVVAAYLAPLAMLALAKHGNPVGPLAYGQTLQQLQNLEIDLISEGLADPVSLKPHLRPFLQVDLANTLALIVCLMAGTAVLPHVLMRNAVTAGVQQTRMSMAWALLFTATVLSAIPAYAALTKHQLYSFVAQGVPFAQLPEVFARDDVRVHGVPFRLYGTVILALRMADPQDVVAAVNHQIGENFTAEYSAWKGLNPQVRATLVDAAKGMTESTFAERFDTWRTKVLPVAAIAAGNKTGKLTQAAISIPPGDAVLFGLQLAGLSRGWIAVFAVGGMLAALGTAMATAWAIAQSAGRVRTSTWPTRIAAVGTAAGAGFLATLTSADWAQLAVWTFSIAAAGLFPVLVLGIWWRRATSAGAVAGMLGGLAVTLTYLGGSHFAPAVLFDATAPLSDAGPMAANKVAQLKTIAEKASPDTKTAAEAALQSYVGGTAIRAGAANWWGIHNTTAGVFGLPLGFLLIILVSLLTRRPSDETLQFVRAIRRPAALSKAD